MEVNPLKNAILLRVRCSGRNSKSRLGNPQWKPRQNDRREAHLLPVIPKTTQGGTGLKRPTGTTPNFEGEGVDSYERRRKTSGCYSRA